MKQSVDMIRERGRRVIRERGRRVIRERVIDYTEANEQRRRNHVPK